MIFFFLAMAAGQVLHVSPQRLTSQKTLVTITWTGIEYPLSNDTLALYIGQNPNVMGTVNVTQATTWKQGSGTISLYLANTRQPWRVRYMSNNLFDLAESRIYAALSAVGHHHLSIVESGVVASWTGGPDDALVSLRTVGGTAQGFQGVGVTYEAKDMCTFPANSDVGFIQPGTLFSAVFEGLVPGEIYEWAVGGEEWRPFVAPPLVGRDTAIDVVLYGDMGVITPFDHTAFWIERGVEQQTSSVRTIAYIERYVAEGTPGFTSKAWKSHMQDPQMASFLGKIAHRWRGAAMEHAVPGFAGTGGSAPRLLMHIGDISYARGMAVIWEYFMESIDLAAGSAPYMVGVGNHEADWPGMEFQPPNTGLGGNDSWGECGVPYGMRFTMPQQENVHMSQRNRRYAFNYGPLAVIVMSSENDFTSGSPQRIWLESTLKSVDRSVTPWVMVMSHRPFFTSCGGCDQGSVQRLLRAELAGVMQRYKVDVVFTGHVHAYERTCGIVNGRGDCAARDEDGVVYVTSGAAGNDYIVGWDTPEFAGHKVAPDWSIFRSVTHGVSELRANATHFEMIFVGTKRGDTHDVLLLTKEA